VVEHFPACPREPLVPSPASQNEKKNEKKCRMLIPVILAILEAEIRRISVQTQPGQMV
jgi:hypothetical protein